MNNSQCLHVPCKFELGEEKKIKKDIKIDTYDQRKKCESMRKQSILKYTESESVII